MLLLLPYSHLGLANFVYRRHDATVRCARRTSENSSSTHSGELTLGTWLLQQPTHRVIMAPPSTAGTHPSDTSEGCGVLPVLTHTISSGPLEHHLPIPSLLHRYISTIRDDRRGLLDALIHFLRFLRLLRNGLGAKTSDWWGR